MGNILWIILAGSLFIGALYAIFFKKKEAKRRWSKEKPKTIDFVGLKNKEKHK